MLCYWLNHISKSIKLVLQVISICFNFNYYIITPIILSSLLFSSDIFGIYTSYRETHNQPGVSIQNVPYLASVHILENKDTGYEEMIFIHPCTIIAKSFAVASPVRLCNFKNNVKYIYAGTNSYNYKNVENYNYREKSSYKNDIQMRCVKKYIEYNQNQETNSYQYNLALLKMDKPLDFSTSFVQPIPILQKWPSNTINIELNIVRWPCDHTYPSKPNEDHPSSLTFKIDKMIIKYRTKKDFQNNLKYATFTATFKELCIKATHKDISSPLVFVCENGKHYLAGISTFVGKICNENSNERFLNITMYIDWMLEKKVKILENVE